MSQFYLHFFKEKARSIDTYQMEKFFSAIEGFELVADDKEVRFNYMHPNLGYQASFVFTRKSKVPNIQRVSPKYLDLNFHLEVPILTPYFFIRFLNGIVKKICEEFNIFILSEMFKDVLGFNAESILKAFTLVKRAYIEKYPDEANRYYFIREEKLNSILRYIDEQKGLSKYYEETNTQVPPYKFIKDETQKPYLGVEWKENDLVVFPPHINYILYRQENDIVKIIDFEEFLSKTDKFLTDVPGFLQGTKVINKKYIKKISKIAKKHKFSPVTKNFTRYHLHQLLDN